MYQTISSASLIVTALLAGFSSGCASHIEPAQEVVETVETPPPLFVFETPLFDSEVARADDSSDELGLQIDALITVNDHENGLLLDEVGVVLNGQWDAVYTAQVRDGFAGRTARVVDIPVRQVTSGGYFTLSVFDPAEASDVRTTVRARIARNAARCEQTIVHTGDLEVKDAFDVPFDASIACAVVTGDLYIDTSDLAALAPLFSVTEVGGDLIIVNNPELADVMALSGLSRVGGEVRIAQNPRLDALQVDALIDAIADGVVGDIVVELSDHD